MTFETIVIAPDCGDYHTEAVGLLKLEVLHSTDAAHSVSMRINKGQTKMRAERICLNLTHFYHFMQ